MPDAVSLQEILCNADGWEFIKALDPQGDVQPTIAMFLAVRNNLTGPNGNDGMTFETIS